MSTQRILDSSPIQPAKRTSPPPSKSLKRSASVASLPTPPRTIKKRSRSRGSAYPSSDDEDALPVVSPHGHEADDDELDFGHKRRRIDAVVAELSSEDHEDAFWLAVPGAPSRAQPKAKVRSTSSVKPSRLPRPKNMIRTSQSTATSSASTSRLRMPSTRPSLTSSRRLSQSRAASVLPAVFSLPSPPPSRLRPPVTPPRRVRAKAKPVRDSPNNPFLEGSPASLPSSPVGPKTPLVEKETLTYVFRGKRQIFPNPHYKAPRDPRSDLPPEHPDFEPSDNCTPRRLFGPPAVPAKPTKPKAQAANARALTEKLPPHRRAMSPPSDGEGDDEEEELDSAGLARGNLAGEFARIREMESAGKGKAMEKSLANAEDDKEDADEYVFVGKEDAARDADGSTP